MSEEYQKFLEAKAIRHVATGIEKPVKIHKSLFPFQRDIVQWALKRGRASVFAGTGLGKTAMQCECARHIEAFTKKPVLILAPLAVSTQTVAEAKKILGMDVKFVAKQSQVESRGVFITNYQKLAHFDPLVFDGVLLDESSCIKSEDAKFRMQLMEYFAHAPFRMAFTASPSPNDHSEIGNHAEFMGSMSMSEMISTFFVHDGGETQKWRLKGHAETDFWRWMASWSVCILKPSDLGYDDDRYNLPKLNVFEHIVEANMIREGEMFAFNAHTMQERRQARRGSLNIRVDRAAELANGNDEQWGIWCNLNDESAAITKAIPGAVEVKGGDKDEHKEKSMIDFANGKIRVVVSKPSICGFGMNFQSCHNTMFVGLSDSFEQYYQAVRRFWRFGQKHEVNAHIIISDSEGAVLDNIKRKEKDAESMQRNLILHMADITKKELGGTARTTLSYVPSMPMKLPPFLLPSHGAKERLYKP